MSKHYFQSRYRKEVNCRERNCVKGKATEYIKYRVNCWRGDFLGSVDANRRHHSVLCLGLCTPSKSKKKKKDEKKNEERMKKKRVFSCFCLLYSTAMYVNYIKARRESHDRWHQQVENRQRRARSLTPIGERPRTV